MKKKFLALVLTLAMVLSLVPVTALAGNTALLSITPDEGNFATYEFYKIDDTSNPWYTQTVKTGDKLNRPADPTRTGYYFTGWKTADGAEVPFDTEVNVTETSTIQCYAQWEKNANPIHVYFMAAEGSKEVVYTGVAKDETVDIPEDYKDITWKTADGKAFEGKNVTNDMNVYPASESCWLTFDSQGGSAIASHYVQQGESFELGKVGNPEKAGYTFAGWSLEANGTKQTEVTPNGDTKLYALWTPATADYTVIHWQENANDDGYSYITSETKSGPTEGQTNAVANSYEGFTEQAIKQQTIKGDGSTIVNVFYKRNVYEVKFKLDKPTYTCGKEEHEHTHGFLGIGSCYDKNNNLKCGKEAHTHDKSCGKTSEIVISAKYGAYIGDKWPTIRGSSAWRTSQYGSTNQVNIDTMPLNGATFYGPETGDGSESAHYYVEVLPGETGTVTQGGVTYKLHHTDTSPGSNFKVTEEDKYPLTGFTYKEGTRDGGWYNNAQFYYTRNIYNVVYFSNDGKVNESSYKYEQDIHDAGSYKPDNAPAGYKFGGWCSDPSGTTKYDFSGKTMPAQNITVYAKWVPITLKLTIQDVDGVGSGDVSYKQAINKASVYTDATAKLAAENKTVLYWVNCETNQKEDVNRQMTTDLTIRPVLKGDTYAVTYDSGATDSQQYWYNTIAKVKNYTGDDDDKFLYWTDADNTNTKYYPGAEIRMTANVTLKPQISDENPVQQKYSVTYHSNFGTDQTYTVNDIENYTKFFTKTYAETGFTNQDGYDFIGWNTQADGKGTNFAAGSPARMDGPDNNHLYAQWSQSTYTLTYDANGGQFGSGDSAPITKQESDIPAGDHFLKYSPEYTPTHAQSGDKDVIFLGWSTTKQNLLTKQNVTTTAPNIITNVNIQDSTTTVYAVWGLDEDGNKIPDVFEATIIYKIVNGQWTKDVEAIGSADITATFQLYEQQADHTWKATNKLLRDGSFPDGYTGTAGYTGLGWYQNSDTTPSPSELVRPTTKVIDAVTGAKTVFTYKYAPTTPQTYTVVLHLEGGSYTTTPGTYTANSDGTYQYSVTQTSAVIKPESPSRNNFGFEGWSLSKNAPQTLIAKDATFASLYLEQSGTSGSFDKIDLYAVWKEAEAPAPQWDTSKSKKATNLDSNYESKVTLSLPSAEEKLDSDIVFVLDKSTSVQLKNQALEMLNALKGQADKTGAKIKVGVVIFNKIANVTEWKDLETQYDDIKAAIEQDIQEGTNIHAGLLAAKKMLDEDTDVAANRKYMILVSDGVTYQFCHNSDYEKAWTRSFNGELHADKVNQRGTLTELNIQYDNAETGIPQNSISAWMTDIQNRMNNGKDCEETYDYEYTGNAPTDTSQLLPAKEYVSNVEKALYLTKNTYEELSTSYNCYAILARETRPWGTDFMNLLAGGSTLNFESVQNNILYLVAAGSKVEDYMGYTSDYNFNFINDASKLTITVGRGDAQKKLDAVKIDDNHYGFGPVTVETDSSDKVTTYRYNLEYIPGNMTDTEHFVWRINVPVENLAPVALTYSVKLVNPKSASGTYGQYDVDGSKNYSGLYTNNSATLYPKDSNNNWGIPENFLKPTVSYTVSGGSGGNHKPTVTIPDDVPTGLNGKDHYAYVVGYPDGMVYPQKNITRAEVATIFFRLLTDETREANMTKSNSYNDMKDGAWYTCAVSTLSKMGIIKGYEDGSFKPDASISRAEFAAIAARFDPDGDKTPATFSDVSSHWAKDEISIAANHGWIKGYEDGSFKPDQKITRAETMTLVNRVLKRLPETKDDLHKDMKTWPDNQNESAWFYLAVQEATNSHYQKLKKDGTHETWESMRETRDWAALEK